jgi:hypothetical protein
MQTNRIELSSVDNSYAFTAATKKEVIVLIDRKYLAGAYQPIDLGHHRRMLEVAPLIPSFCNV